MDGDEGKKMVRASRPTNISDTEGSDDTDKEPGEVIESAPPLKVGEEREINASGLILKKRSFSNQVMDGRLRSYAMKLYEGGELLDMIFSRLLLDFIVLVAGS
ncbi:hypothetical protein MRB53_003976 [Persea americana]|uniref:Uncharacterized protein n=1 Tax=Persea americana TaxID=3435 RepID=A0ACC2MZS7_PERAE|nr:hypothetical protein MRB53_003976 [Persea americana]